MSVQTVHRVCERINLAVTVVCVLLLCALILINSLEITLRSFFNTSLSWIFETNTLLAVWLYFLGIAVVYHKGKDVSVTVVQDRLPPSTRLLYGRAMQLVTAAVYLACAWYAWRLIALQWPFRTPGVGFPRAAFTVPLFIGLVLIVVECLRRVMDPRVAASGPALPGEVA